MQLREGHMKLEAIRLLVEQSEPRAPGPPFQGNVVRHLTDSEIHDLVEARMVGVKINDLAEQFGVNRSTVLRQLRKVGLSGPWPDQG